MLLPPACNQSQVMTSSWSSTKRSMKRSGTFVLKQSQPMVNSPNPNPNPILIPTPPTTTYHPTRKYPHIEYPASPQLVVGEEILHFSHPQHPLSEMILPDLYTCAGCKEYGSDRRFSCQLCDFQLHEFCALAPPALFSHPFHSHHQLLLYSKPVKGGIHQSNKCNVCAKPTKGFAFRCGACGFQMHPCCAMLPEEIVFPGHHHALKILPAADGGDYPCGVCKRRRPGRVFRCKNTCDYHVHAVCAKDMVNGLMANGLKARDRPSVLGAAAKVASVAVMEFLGGLIEGIGEGVGQVLVQNAARGR